MKTLACAALLALAAAGQAGAANYGIGYAYWDYDVSGVVENQGDRIDLERDIDIQTRNQNAFELRWDTGPGWTPDLAARYFHIDAGGRREVTADGGIGPIPLPGTEAVVLADADLDDYDLTLRYPAALWGGTAWGGVTLKRLDGTVVTREEDDTEEAVEQVDELFPLLHGELALPVGERVVLGLRTDWLRYDGNQALELALRAEWRAWGPLWLSAGWRRKDYQIDSGSFDLDATLDGALLGARVAFE